jgi:hypothetical protein
MLVASKRSEVRETRRMGVPPVASEANKLKQPAACRPNPRGGTVVQKGKDRGKPPGSGGGSGRTFESVATAGGEMMGATVQAGTATIGGWHGNTLADSAGKVPQDMAQATVVIGIMITASIIVLNIRNVTCGRRSHAMMIWTTIAIIGIHCTRLRQLLIFHPSVRGHRNAHHLAGKTRRELGGQQNQQQATGKEGIKAAHRQNIADEIIFAKRLTSLDIPHFSIFHQEKTQP